MISTQPQPGARSAGEAEGEAAEEPGIEMRKCPRKPRKPGSEHTWIPGVKLEKIGVVREKKGLRFVMANGEVVTRSLGFAILHVGKHFTIDEVVFAEPGDQTLLGARTLEGLNLTVDSTRKKLVAAGPFPAA